MVLKAGGVHAVKGLGFDVQHSDSVVLLQGHIGLAAGNSDVLRLQVLGGGAALFQDDAILGQLVPLAVKGGKVHHSALPGFHIHHSDGALGVGDVFPVALPGLAFVRGQHHAVPGESDHVGLGAGFHQSIQGEAAVLLTGEQGHPAGVVGALCLEGGGQGGAVRGNGHGSHVAVLEGAVLRLYQRFHIDFRPGKLLHMGACGEARQGDGRQLAALAVDGVGPLRRLVVGNNFHHAAVHVVLARAVPGDLGQVQRCRSVFIAAGGNPLGGSRGPQLQGQAKAQGQGSGAFCFVLHGKFLLFHGCWPGGCSRTAGLSMYSIQENSSRFRAGQVKWKKNMCKVLPFFSDYSRLEWERHCSRQKAFLGGNGFPTSSPRHAHILRNPNLILTNALFPFWGKSSTLVTIGNAGFCKKSWFRPRFFYTCPVFYQ